MFGDRTYGLHVSLSQWGPRQPVDGFRALLWIVGQRNFAAARLQDRDLVRR